MEKRTIYRELANGKELEIRISYDNGKDYPYNPKGIYARMTELTRTPHPSACGGFIVTWSSGDPYEWAILQRVTRGSQKKVDAWRDAFEEAADDIADLWNQKRYKRAIGLIFDLVPADL